LSGILPDFTHNHDRMKQNNVKESIKRKTILKLLVIGSGGREHAIAKKLLDSPEVTAVYAAPGNAGMVLDGIETIAINIDQHSELIDFVKSNDITFTFVGPDDALLAGIVDDFETAGLSVFGPTKRASGTRMVKRFCKTNHESIWCANR
jgi:phosphoribosylamine--glycine ligase